MVRWICLLLLLSTPAFAQGNTLVNPGFEDGFSAEWVNSSGDGISLESDAPLFGVYSARLQSVDVSGTFYLPTGPSQTVSAIGGATYFGCWLKRLWGDALFAITISDLLGGPSGPTLAMIVNPSNGEVVLRDMVYEVDIATWRAENIEQGARISGAIPRGTVLEAPALFLGDSGIVAAHHGEGAWLVDGCYVGREEMP